MNFIWPWALALLVLLPLLVFVYLRGLRRPAQAAAIHPDLALLALARGRSHPLRRHLPPALYLGAVGLSLLAVSRPQAAVPLPDDRTAIIQLKFAAQLQWTSGKQFQIAGPVDCNGVWISKAFEAPRQERLRNADQAVIVDAKQKR